MMMLTGIAPSPVQAPPVGVPPKPPLTGVSTSFVVDLTEASRLAAKAVEMLGTVPLDDVGSEATKDLRGRILKTNLAVQKRLEKQAAEGNPAAVLSDLKTADAYLEDANWQLVRVPSPDGRFNGVDIPGAVRDTSEGARIINELLQAAGGAPTAPSTPPPVGPPTTPFPPTPFPSPSPSPPSPPSPPSGPPSSGAPDPGYPGEDEFPKDD